jgi:membrane protease YdiL (CAAX protease family)
LIDEAAQGPAHPWGFWATLAWLALVLALWLWGFDRLEHALLNGTAFGRMIGTNVALGALNLLLTWSVPLVVVLAAVRIRRCRVRDYLGWLSPRARDVLLAVLLALAVQFVYYAFFYLAGEDITAAGVAQYRAETTARAPHWVPMLLGWPAIICAPIVEETVFRGFVWRGWAQSPLGAAGTWLLTSLVFAAYHVPNALEMHPALAGVMLVQVFLLGLSLGWVRWRSGTTSATIIGHVAHNLVPPLFAFVVGAMFARTTMIG